MWKTISSKMLLKHPRLTVIEDVVELPQGQHVTYLKYGASNGAVMVICVRNDMVLVQQEYSYPPNETLYQFPGGKVEDGENLKQAIKRELAEESSLMADNFEGIGWFYTDNRRSASKMHVFLTINPKKINEIPNDLEEEIISEWLPITSVDTMIRKGAINNYSFLAGWALFKASKPKMNSD